MYKLHNVEILKMLVVAWKLNLPHVRNTQEYTNNIFMLTCNVLELEHEFHISTHSTKVCSFLMRI